MNIIIVTGASSGMGKEFVRQIDARFPKVDEIWIIARRKDKLEELEASCRHKCRILDLDLTKEISLESLADMLKLYKARIRLLINCAGFGLLGDIAALSREEQTTMIHLNCQALTAVTHICLPYMSVNSRIIQMASSAAFLPQPGFAVYAATKSYVLSFSQALRQEIKDKEIYVTAVCPGPVDTEFFEIAERYEGKLEIKKLVMVTAEKVVEKALLDSRNKKAISVYGMPMKGFLCMTKLMPHGVLLNGMSMINKLLRRIS